jgi:type I restriction enzyme R subunit
VLEALLQKYATEGMVDELDNVKILRIPPFSAMGTLVELVGEFGGKAGFERAVHELQAELYPEAA